jgi:serpin B
MKVPMKLLHLTLASILFLEAAGSVAQQPVPSGGSQMSADVSTIAQDNNAFSVDLYGKLSSEPGNLFFSPASVTSAFAMAYAGARGTTASEMASTLHFALTPDRLHPAMGALLTQLNGPHTNYELHMANALWAEKDQHFLADYIDLTKRDYGAGFQPVDFKSDPEAARALINNWVAQQTQQKILNLVPAGSVTPLTRLILTNAIYFKAAWAEPFSKSQTQSEDFHLSASQSVKADLMHLDLGGRYFRGPDFQAIELTYKSNELSMIVLLPDDLDGLPALEKSFTVANIDKWIGSLLNEDKIVVTFPRFKITQQFELSAALEALGMKQAFQASTADFSAITGHRDLYISAAIHKAYIDVDEEGTEAAAATAIALFTMIMRQAPAPPIVFRADHPFLFLIRDNKSGAILFIGRLTDPTK